MRSLGWTTPCVFIGGPLDRRVEEWDLYDSKRVVQLEEHFEGSPRVEVHCVMYRVGKAQEYDVEGRLIIRMSQFLRNVCPRLDH